MLPSFGGGRNVIAGGARKPSSVITEIQSPAPDGGTPGSTASKTFSPLQKKRKLDVDNTNAPSESTPKKKSTAASKKKGGDKKAGDKEPAAAAGSVDASGKAGTAGAVGAAAGPADKDDADGGRGDGEGPDRREGEGSRNNSDEEGDVGSDADQDAKYEASQKEKEKMYLSNCTEEEWQRYGALRASKLDNQIAKQLISQVSDLPAGSLSKQLVFTITGVAKMLVGELVDEARLIRHEWKDDDSRPLQPRHVQEGFRRMLRAGKIPECTRPRPRFRR